MGESRKDVLMKALEAEVSGGSDELGSMFTDDVVGGRRTRPCPG